MTNPAPIKPTVDNVLASRYWLTDAGLTATDPAGACRRCHGSGEVGENRPGRAPREEYGQPVTRVCSACEGSGRG